MIITVIEESMVHSYSDRKVKIHGGFPEGDYDEVYDPINSGRTYTETDIPIDEEITIEDKAQAYDILMGESND